ncbi:MAG: DUF1566 domain-containing protein [Candidatus Contendobacter sp.]|nr:DUF1566 domain-containing protein [Candidatus Contendobacter sp.]
MTDTVTGLIWVRNAGCFGGRQWVAANQTAAALADGQCGLLDGSSAGDWRLPTKEEWEATVAQARYLGCLSPSLTNTAGSGCYYSGGSEPFVGVLSNIIYWSSTTDASNPSVAWYVSLGNGGVSSVSKNVGGYVWPVRGGR